MDRSHLLSPARCDTLARSKAPQGWHLRTSSFASPRSSRARLRRTRRETKHLVDLYIEELSGSARPTYRSAGLRVNIFVHSTKTRESRRSDGVRPARSEDADRDSPDAIHRVARPAGATHLAYAPTTMHVKHPCTLWIGASTGNYAWAVEHGIALCEEHGYRYPDNPVHAA